ncbi:hypothetical protein BOTCAL_0243g00040 [Botryotinia calthae]|uniref:Uncharacterized protein n=1 Tax=Botryotinia calthae TaxID=38488 RepID=A0A4Y8CZH0_9HELO|nr:hypothetical protein BOTCAL_0243g00040 [Botryotinia calthae]
MGCALSKLSVPPNEKHQRRSTRGANATRTSDESSLQAPRSIAIPSSHRAVSTRNNLEEVSTEQNSQKEQDTVKESRLSWTIPERRSSLGVITLGAQTGGANTLEPGKLGAHSGRRRIGQSISNPNPSSAPLPTPRQYEEDYGSRPVSPVSSVGTTKWDRPGFVLKR